MNLHNRKPVAKEKWKAVIDPTCEACWTIAYKYNSSLWNC